MTIQQHASFDSSAAELNATSKLVKPGNPRTPKTQPKPVAYRLWHCRSQLVAAQALLQAATRRYGRRCWPAAAAAAAAAEAAAATAAAYRCC